MKIILRFSLVLAAIMLVNGCSYKQQDGTSQQKGSFPPELAGTWIAGEGNWKIIFDPNGKLNSIVYYFMINPLIVEQGGGYDLYDDGSVRTLCIFGPINVNYNEPNNFLTLKIKIDQFEMNRAAGLLTGWMDDTFEGKLSEDKKTWYVKWLSTTKFDQFDEPSKTVYDLVFTKADNNL